MNVQTSAEVTTGATPQWFVYAQGEVLGPFLLDQMVALVREGRMTRKSQTTRRGSPDWKCASEDEDLETIFSDVAVGRPSLPSSLPAASMQTRLVVKPRPHAEMEDVAPAPAAQVTLPPVSPHETHVGVLTNTGLRLAASDPAAGPTQARMASAPWAPAAEADTSVKGNQRLAASDDPHPLVSGLASLLLPGSGQIRNGEIMRGLAFGTAALLLWRTDLGWIVHMWAAVDAVLRAGTTANRLHEIRNKDSRAVRRSE